MGLRCPRDLLMSSLGVSHSLFLHHRLKKQAGCHGSPGGTETVVTYFFCGEEIPYRRVMKTHSLTLGHFKEQLRKKGNYRYAHNGVWSLFVCCSFAFNLSSIYLSIFLSLCLRFLKAHFDSLLHSVLICYLCSLVQFSSLFPVASLLPA